MSDTKSHDEQVRKIGEMIADARICVLTTVDADGALWSRPMAIQADDFDGVLHFFSSADSEKVAHIGRNPNVAVSFGFADRPAVELGADRVIDHFDELLAALATL